MNILIDILLTLAYLSTGMYVSGRFGFTFSPDYGEDWKGVCAFFCPILWPAFFLGLIFYRFWQWGTRRSL